MSGEIEIPHTLDEFRLALGKAVVADMRQQLGFNPVVRGLSVEYFTVVADRWLQQYKEPLKGIAAIARRAVACHGDAQFLKLISDVREDAYGTRSFLTACQPDYFAKVFKAGTTQPSEQRLRDFLKLLMQLSS